MQTQVFETREEAVAAALRWKDEDAKRDLVPCADPVHACWGIEGFPDRVCAKETLYRQQQAQRDTVQFLWPRYEAPLEAVERVATTEELTAAMLNARLGLFAQADDQSTRRLRACTYDLEKGMSYVLATPLVEVSNALPSRELRDTWVQHDWRSLCGREALGGYAEARTAAFAEIRLLTWRTPA